MTDQPSLLTILEPINPHQYVDRIPGIDAPCLDDRKDTCMYPFCCCYAQHEPERNDR